MQKVTFDRDIAAARRERLQLRARRENLELRAILMAGVREFFDQQGFLAVETPVRIETPAMEEYIEVEKSGEWWLRTSPEFHMKRMLAAGYEKIYQIGPCFRPGELGHRHQPEFTMLEWYRLESDWRQLAKDIMELTIHLVKKTGKHAVSFRGNMLELTAPWPEITVDEAFRRYAGADVDKACEDGNFEEILVSQVEPHLGQGKPQFLTEYPLACSGLSRQFPERPNRVERWELYASGVEIANACTELTDAVEQERRFIETAELRERENRPVYGIDQPFMNALHLGMPQAAGVAIGLDRLVMMFCGADSIEDVIAFPQV